MQSQGGVGRPCAMFHKRCRECSTKPLIVVSRRRAATLIRDASSDVHLTRIVVLGPGALVGILESVRFMSPKPWSLS
jgi:hypothetical protein